ncbi:MAG: 4-hydroxyphenylpyruvate dioxygenase [Aphanocapsa sp. GSE-SYN-MK-11-07L]|nr:4-hydroxyphenylpyruvate dioxygenase [Aphanocapsa sp. GSE-SYN-MK-11-07L]
MDIDHIHFYVEDAQRWRDWFSEIGFAAVGTQITPHTRTEIVHIGDIYFALSSPLSQHSPVAQFLDVQAVGVTDLALRVADLPVILNQAIAAGAKLLQPLQVETTERGELKLAQIQGWGNLRHTLVQRTGSTPLLPGLELVQTDQAAALIQHIDHCVLNVANPDLPVAIAWYEKVLGLRGDRSFAIQTQRSALRSQVLVHPQGSVQFPINEPASPSSQIQEFLNINRGSGIQHIALRTNNIVAAIADLRQRGLQFLKTPASYYQNLRQRLPEKLLLDLKILEEQQILVDWHPEQPQRLLLQIFTEPIFAQPTFFLEIIERRSQAEGFGEGNFLALFEAIEREQIKRGSLG